MAVRSYLAALAAAFVWAVTASPALAQCTHHTFLGNGPDEGDPGWHEEAQGLTHDADNWYVTQNPSGVPRLWRIPVTHDLSDEVSCGTGGVSCSSLATTELDGLGYNHYGDPDFYEYDGHPYVLVPIENGSPGPAIAVFRGDASLEYLTYATIPSQTHSSWIAVANDGSLVSSEFDPVTSFHHFRVDWAAFVDSGETALTIHLLQSIPLIDENLSPLVLRAAQGGEFSDDFTVLYFSNGGGGLPQATWGVHAFRIRIGMFPECAPVGSSCLVARRLEHSNNSPGGFAYEFDTGNEEEPEGLTSWDLDADGRAPGLGGQLHVVLLDNDTLSDDDVYVKHYSADLEDREPPTIQCPADVSVECSLPQGVASSDARLTSFFNGGAAQDTCDDHVHAPADPRPPFFPLGSTQVGFSAHDDSNNTSSCTARLTVADTIPPVISCPAALTVATDPGRCSATVNPGVPTVVDVCSATVGATRSDAQALGAPFPRGTTTITWTATDRAGHAVACLQSIVVKDLQGPVVTLLQPNHDVLGLPPISIPVTVHHTSADNCTAVSREQIKLQGCTIYDGATLGDRDGLLSDEPVQLTKYNLCQFMAQCGFTVLYSPVLRVEATDAYGNVGFDQHILRKNLLKTEVCARP